MTTGQTENRIGSVIGGHQLLLSQEYRLRYDVSPEQCCAGACKNEINRA
ncbi:MAG: hypothetical protein KGM99_03915 [Burkholderiales bacterium]|nr:hypothetical protein [Burkholderiales bacterium]